MRGLAFRRYQQKRIKARVRRFLRWFYQPEWVSAKVIGLRAITRVPCSCWLCGNPRRYFGNVTRQERLVALRCHCSRKTNT